MPREIVESTSPETFKSVWTLSLQLAIAVMWDQMIFRVSFQPQLLCDSLILNIQCTSWNEINVYLYKAAWRRPVPATLKQPLEFGS